MGHIYVAISPCELTPEGRGEVERDYPGLQMPAEGWLPSRADIEAAFAAHPDWNIDFHDGKDWWTAFVRSPNRTASLRVDDYLGDPSKPQSFHFDTGDPDLVVDVVAAIAVRCGAFLVADESGSMAVLISSDGMRQSFGEYSVGSSGHSS